jgi:hypothetical protein
MASVERGLFVGNIGGVSIDEACELLDIVFVSDNASDSRRGKHKAEVEVDIPKAWFNEAPSLLCFVNLD